ALPVEVMPWLIKGGMILFAGLVVWSCRTPRLRNADFGLRIDQKPSARNPQCNLSAAWRLSAEFSIVLLGMLLFSERTWKHHCVTHLLPFTVLCCCLSAHWPRNKGVLIGTLLTVFLLIASTSTGSFDHHDLIGKMAQVYGTYVWANVLMVAVLVVLLTQRDAIPQDECRLQMWRLSGAHARTSDTTDPCTSGTGRSSRSVSV